MAIIGTSGADTLVGTTSNDTILAGGGSDTVMAGAGHDIVTGGAGNDVIAGAAGPDTLSGGTGNDVLHGGADNDIIIGGGGRDIMSGGAGADTFIFQSATDSGVGVGSRDIVLDFQVGIDKLGLSALHLTRADIDLSHYYAGTDATTAYAQLLRVSTHHDGVYDFEIQLNTQHSGIAVTLADLLGVMP